MSSPYLPRIDNLMTGIGNPIAGHLFTNTQNELHNK